VKVDVLCDDEVGHAVAVWVTFHLAAAVGFTQSRSELAEDPRSTRAAFDHSCVSRFSLLHVANHHERDRADILITAPVAVPSAAMSNALAEYLSAIEARDVREQAHAEYINACE
jgi:hypothetical protein